MIGINAKIEVLRGQIGALYAAFPSYKAYGRAFVNRRADGNFPEINIEGTNEYEDVLLDTGIAGLNFFIVDNDIEGFSDVDLIATVSLYFAVNLNTLYPAVQERATEYIHRDIITLIADSEFEFISLQSGLTSFEEFEFVKAADNMQPFYLCKFNISVEYQVFENNKC